MRLLTSGRASCALYMKDIQGYEGIYALTIEGRVWSYPKNRRRLHSTGKIFFDVLYKNGRFINPCLNQRDGYYRVDLRRKNYLLHRLLAIAFIPNPLNLPQINHKNGIKTDNRIENLEWCTDKQNKHHGLAIGLYKRDKTNGQFTPSKKTRSRT